MVTHVFPLFAHSSRKGNRDDLFHHLSQGSSSSGPWTGTGPQPVRNWATQQEASGRRVGGRASEASSATRYRPPSLALLPEPSLPPPPSLWQNCLPCNRSLVPKRLGSADLSDSLIIISTCDFFVYFFIMFVDIYCLY